MVAPIQSARLIDGADEGPLRAVALIRRGYVPGELMPPDAVAAVPPVVDNIIPASGSELGAADTVQFDITHPDGASALSEFFVLVFSREWECAYDLRSESFGPAFGGTRTAITDGYRFVIFRREGWRFLPGSGLEIYAAPRTTDGATSS